MKTKKAFTIVELLTVMGVIVVLFGILAPSMNAVRRYSKVVVQKGQFHQIGIALAMFDDTKDGLPDSLWSDIAGVPYCGAMKLCEALVGQDGLGFHPDSKFKSDSGGLYLSMSTGSPTYTPEQIKSIQARELFLENSKIKIYPLVQMFPAITPFVSTDPNGGAAVICDVFNRVTTVTGEQVGLPILYYKADVRNMNHNIITPTDPQNIYDFEDNYQLVNLIDSTAPLCVGETSIGDVFYKNTLYKGKSAIDTPYNKDSYILISAGWDGIYGTQDDVYNFTK